MTDLNEEIRDLLTAEEGNLRTLQGKLFDAGHYSFATHSQTGEPLTREQCADGIWGGNSEQAIMNFLEDGDNFQIADELNQHLNQNLRLSDHGRDFTLLSRKGAAADASLEQLVGHRSLIDEEAVRIQELLHAEDYYRGAIDGDIGSGTQAALIKKIGDSPDLLARMSPEMLEALMDDEHVRVMSQEQKIAAIQEAAVRSPAFLQRVSDELQFAEGTPNMVPQILRTRSTLLKAAGYYNGPITEDHNDDLTEGTRRFEDEHANLQSANEAKGDDLTAKAPSEIAAKFASKVSADLTEKEAVTVGTGPKPDGFDIA